MARSSPRERTRGHKKHASANHASAIPPRSLETAAQRSAAWVIVVLLMVTPLLVITSLKEGFRLPQGLAGGWLGLASLFAASFVLRDIESIPLHAAAWWRQPALRALTPLAAVVAAGALTTAHSAHFRAAFTDFAIGVACVVGWSLALSAPTLRRLLVWTIPPAVIVAALGVDQALGWFGTLDWLHVQAPTARLRITSTVGNPGDLAGLLVLPTLIAVEEIASASRRRRALLAGALIVMTTALIVTATLAAVAAIVVGLAVWTLPRLWPGADGVAVAPGTAAVVPVPVFRRRRMTVLLAGTLVLALAVAGLAASTPLRARVSEKVMQLASGDINALLTGRLDGWRAAWAMLRAEPVTGVGQGAFRAEYADTRLALEAQGVTFLSEQQQVVMATPHNEALSVAAEQGLPGLLALAWAMWVLIASAGLVGAPPNRSDGSASDRAHDHTLAAGGLAALGVLSLVSFPLHVPAIAWPWLLFLAWVFLADRSSTGPPSELAAPSATGRAMPRAAAESAARASAGGGA
jgi:O-antigen ligase